MDRRTLEDLRLKVADELATHGLTAASISKIDVIDRVIWVYYEGHRYSVPAHIFELFNVKHIADCVKRAHEIAQK